MLQARGSREEQTAGSQGTMKVSVAACDCKNSQPLSAQQFARAVEAALASVANPAQSPAMRAYMKDQFAYLGVKAPELRAAIAEIVRQQKNASAADLLRCARLLWDMHEREYQYAAVHLLAHHVDKFTPRHLNALLALVQKKSWWDTVDSLAGVIGRVVKKASADDPAAQILMDKALASPNLWVRRVAILHQLGWRKQTDSKLLFTYATTCAREKDFFIRKAIGWALRDYARHAPAEVRRFLRVNRSKLSPLTMREAGKHILCQ